MHKKTALLVAIILLTAGSSFAGTAGNTSDPKLPYGSGIAKMKAAGLGPFKASFDFEHTLAKKLDGSDDTSTAEMEGQKYLVRLGYTFADRVEPYLKLGVSNYKASWRESGFDLRADAEYGLATGVGTKIGIFEMQEHKLKVGLDWQYLYSAPDIKSVYINEPNRSVSATEFNVSEWQVVALVSMEFPLGYDRKDPAAISCLVPYLGLGYADSENDVRLRSAGIDFDLGKAKTKDKLLLVGGCDILAPDNIALNVEGRLISEESVSGGCTVKF